MVNKKILREGKFFYNRLKKLYPESVTYLVYDTPFQLLVATVLSAQTTDENVNNSVKTLFKNYPDMDSLSKAHIRSIEKMVYSCGYFKQKAKNIKTLSKILIKDYNSVIPTEIEELIKLPGVGRKTASVYMAEIYNQPAIAVDTHVMRISYRIGLTKNYKDPLKIEEDLKKIYPKKEWSNISMRFIQFGREYCDARKPKCQKCFYLKRCGYKGKTAI